MKVLIVGSGGREHAIAASVAKSDKVDKIYCAPGNAGIAQLAECVAIGAMEFDKLVAFAKAYANELGYDIDDMATLALYNRISNIQRLDEPTNLIEIKEIVDEAIARVEKGGLKKMFSILTSRRYTEDDYIALREKDFDE